MSLRFCFLFLLSPFFPLVKHKSGGCRLAKIVQTGEGRTEKRRVSVWMYTLPTTHEVEGIKVHYNTVPIETYGNAE